MILKTLAHTIDDLNLQEKAVLAAISVVRFFPGII